MISHEDYLPEICVLGVFYETLEKYYVKCDTLVFRAFAKQTEDLGRNEEVWPHYLQSVARHDLRIICNAITNRIWPEL